MKQKKTERAVRYEITRNGVKLVFFRINDNEFSISLTGDDMYAVKAVVNMKIGAIPEDKIDYYAREIHHFIDNMEDDEPKPEICSYCGGTGIDPHLTTQIQLVAPIVSRPCFSDPNCCPECKGEQYIHIHKGNT